MSHKKHRWMDGFAISPKKKPEDSPYIKSSVDDRHTRRKKYWSMGMSRAFRELVIKQD